MDFLHRRELLNQGDVVLVNCSHQCNVILLDDDNFSKYRSGQRFKYFGGFQKILPAKIIAPKQGYWTVVLDLGGASGTVSHSIRIIKK